MPEHWVLHASGKSAGILGLFRAVFLEATVSEAVLRPEDSLGGLSCFPLTLTQTWITKLFHQEHSLMWGVFLRHTSFTTFLTYDSCFTNNPSFVKFEPGFPCLATRACLLWRTKKSSVRPSVRHLVSQLGVPKMKTF